MAKRKKMHKDMWHLGDIGHFENSRNHRIDDHTNDGGHDDDHDGFKSFGEF